MADVTWAEKIENASDEQQRKMRFGPFSVHLGRLVTLQESLIRTPKAVDVPAPWPIAEAPGWLTHRLDANWSITAWCALGGEWIFDQRGLDKRSVHISSRVPLIAATPSLSGSMTPFNCLLREMRFHFASRPL
jgi:hypothetical protein